MIAPFTNVDAAKNKNKILDYLDIDVKDPDMYAKIKLGLVYYHNVYCRPWAIGASHDIDDLLSRFNSVIYYAGYAYFLDDTDYAMYILEKE